MFFIVHSNGSSTFCDMKSHYFFTERIFSILSSPSPPRRHFGSRAETEVTWRDTTSSPVVYKPVLALLPRGTASPTALPPLPTAVTGDKLLWTEGFMWVPSKKRRSQIRGTQSDGGNKFNKARFKENWVQRACKDGKVNVMSLKKVVKDTEENVAHKIWPQKKSSRRAEGKTGCGRKAGPEPGPWAHRRAQRPRAGAGRCKRRE